MSLKHCLGSTVSGAAIHHFFWATIGLSPNYQCKNRPITQIRSLSKASAIDSLIAVPLTIQLQPPILLMENLMKKIAFSVCLTLLLASFSVAQDDATIAPPAAPSPDVTPVAQAVEAVATEVTRAADAAAAPAATAPVQTEQQLVVDATPVEGVADAATAAPADVVVDQGIVINEGAVADQGMIIQGEVYGQVYDQAPVYSENQISSLGQSVMAPVETEMAPIASYDQGVVTEPAPMTFEAAPAVSADPFAAPSMVAPTPVASYSQAPACVDCNNSNNGRRIFRAVTTRGRSVFTRVRGIFGRRR